MKLLITRPAIITGAGGTRAFVPGITVEVNEATAQQILDQQAGIPTEPAEVNEPPAAPRRRKPTDAQT